MRDAGEPTSTSSLDIELLRRFLRVSEIAMVPDALDFVMPPSLVFYVGLSLAKATCEMSACIIWFISITGELTGQITARNYWTETWRQKQINKHDRTCLYQ